MHIPTPRLTSRFARLLGCSLPFLAGRWSWLVALGLTLAALGYISVMLGWRLWVVAALKKRKAERDPH